MGLHPAPEVDLLDLHDRIKSDLTGCAILGTNDGGAPVQLNLKAMDMHSTLVAGSAGTGKTSLIRSIILSIALTSSQRHVQLAIIDPGGGHGRAGNSGSGLHLLGFLPHCSHPMATSHGEIKRLLAAVTKEVEIREARRTNNPLLLLVIDDIDLVMEDGDAEVRRMLVRLLQNSGRVGLRLILGARTIRDTELLKLLRLNVPLRLVGKTKNGAHARLLAGVSTDRLREIRYPGRFVALAHGHQLPFDGAFIDDYDLHFVVTTLGGKKSGTILARPKADLEPSQNGRHDYNNISSGEMLNDQESNGIAGFRYELQTREIRESGDTAAYEQRIAKR
jgi:DNA segregation ATPase FtsK/SpoIIIE-like protein